MPSHWRIIQKRIARDAKSDGIFVDSLVNSLQQLFNSKQNATNKSSFLDWPTILFMVCIVIISLIAVIGTFTLCILFGRRIWRYTTRMRRKAALRNFEPTTCIVGLPRRFSHGLMIEGHSPKSRRFNSTSRIFELPTSNGEIPQIRISLSSGRLTPDRPQSAMSNSSALPPWTESRSSIATTLSNAPGSPASFTRLIENDACQEPLIGIKSSAGAVSEASGSSFSIQTLGSFWQRVAKRSIRFTQQQQIERQRLLGQVQQNFLLEVEVPYRGVECPTEVQSPVCQSRLSSVMGHLSSENGSNHHDEDRDMDERSVAHYELGFHNGDKASAGCFRGTLTFQLRYDFIHRVLMLHVIRSNRLPTTDGAPDPYIKMYCLPERRNHCKTSIFKKSADPEFNEMFSFDVPYNQLPNRMLQFTVYDFDRFTRHGLIGNVIMRDLFEKSDLYNWTEFTMQIVGSQEKNDFGDLLLYLAYSIQLRKLYVTVSKAYNLRPMDITGASDPYVKVELIYQRKRVKMRKTSIKRANLNPVYHECLEFDLPPSQVYETNLLVQVMDWDRIGRDDLLGCCVVGRESTTREGRQQWEQCFASAGLPPDPTSLIPHSLSVGADRLQTSQHRDSIMIGNGCGKEGNHLGCTQENNFLSSCAPQMSISQYEDDEELGEEDRLLNVNGDVEVPTENGKGCRLSLKMTQSAPTTAKTSTVSGANGQPADGVPRAVGVWHSILGEVPVSFLNIPKTKKK